MLSEGIFIVVQVLRRLQDDPAILAILAVTLVAVAALTFWFNRSRA